MSPSGASGRPVLPDALRGLTVRGRSFLTGGLVAVAVAVLVGQRDLLRVGAFLAAVPLLSAWVVSRTRYRLSCTRRLQPARVAAGQDARVVLHLDNVSRLATGLLLVEDRVPYLLGARPRFVLDRVEPRGQRVVAYPVRSEVRGRFALGPLSLRLTDPFGMCELRRSFTAQDVLTVTPVIRPLSAVHLGGEWSGSGESRSRSLAAAGEDDVGTREYRHGDPLHRVHWRSTARYGELMVRREEQPWQSRATLLLDTRARAHRGDGPGSSVEWAISAVASLGVHLTGTGYAVRLLTDTGASVSSAAHDPDGVGGDFEGLLLDALAVVAPSSGSGLREVGPALRRGGDTLLVAVLGALDLEQAADLTRLHHAPATAVAVLLDVASWAVLPERARVESTRAYDASATLLARAGWRVVRARAGDDLVRLWPQAGHGVRGLGLSGAATAAPTGAATGAPTGAASGPAASRP